MGVIGEKIDFSKTFSKEDRLTLIEIYHQLSDIRVDKYTRFFEKIKDKFNIEISRVEDVERFRSWFKRVRRELDRSYQGFDLSEKIKAKLNQIEIEKEKLRFEKRELREILRGIGRTELIKEYLDEAIADLNIKKPITNTKSIRVDKSDSELVLMLSDCHYGQIVKASSVWPLINEFNPDVFEDRMEQLGNALIEIGEQTGVKKLNIFELGDELENDVLFKNQKLNISDVVIQQLIKYSEYKSQWLQWLSEYFYIEEEKAMGNHTRNTPKREDALNENNYSLLAQHFIKLRTADCENIHINENQSEYIIKDILGHSFLGLHGHQVKNMDKVIQEYSYMFKKRFDFVLFGHYHHLSEMEPHGSEVLGNGSLVGVNNYGINIQKTSKPSQKCFLLNRQGRVCTWNIKLD